MPLSLDVEDGDYILAASTFFDNTVEGQVYDDSENNGVSGVTRETIGFAEVTALGDDCLIESYRHDVTADETRAISINKWDGAPPTASPALALW
jgi:Mg2+/Co2+ transporter CorC